MTHGSVTIEDLVPKWQRDLVYIDYRDGLTEEQVEELIHGEFPSSLDEWISEAQWDSAWEIAGELLEQNPGLSQDQADLAMEIVEIDTSDPYKDLANATGRMQFRFSPGSDDMVWLDEELDDPVAACEALGLAPEFAPTVAKILPEVAGYRAEGGGWFGATFVFDADVADMIKWGTHVTVQDPFLWFTNPMSGNGWGEVAEGCSVTLPKADVHVDRYAWGYGAADVFGGLLLDDSPIEISTKEDN